MDETYRIALAETSVFYNKQLTRQTEQADSLRRVFKLHGMTMRAKHVAALRRDLFRIEADMKNTREQIEREALNLTRMRRAEAIGGKQTKQQLAVVALNRPPIMQRSVVPSDKVLVVLNILLDVSGSMTNNVSSRIKPLGDPDAATAKVTRLFAKQDEQSKHVGIINPDVFEEIGGRRSELQAPGCGTTRPDTSRGNLEGSLVDMSPQVKCTIVERMDELTASENAMSPNDYDAFFANGVGHQPLDRNDCAQFIAWNLLKTKLDYQNTVVVGSVSLFAQNVFTIVSPGVQRWCPRCGEPQEKSHPAFDGSPSLIGTGCVARKVWDAGSPRQVVCGTPGCSCGIDEFICTEPLSHTLGSRMLLEKFVRRLRDANDLKEVTNLTRALGVLRQTKEHYQQVIVAKTPRSPTAEAMRVRHIDVIITDIEKQDLAILEQNKQNLTGNLNTCVDRSTGKNVAFPTLVIHVNDEPIDSRLGDKFTVIADQVISLSRMHVTEALQRAREFVLNALEAECREVTNGVTEPGAPHVEGEDNKKQYTTIIKFTGGRKMIVKPGQTMQFWAPKNGGVMQIQEMTRVIMSDIDSVI